MKPLTHRSVVAHIRAIGSLIGGAIDGLFNLGDDVIEQLFGDGRREAAPVIEHRQAQMVTISVNSARDSGTGADGRRGVNCLHNQVTGEQLPIVSAQRRITEDSAQIAQHRRGQAPFGPKHPIETAHYFFADGHRIHEGRWQPGSLEEPCFAADTVHQRQGI